MPIMTPESKPVDRTPLPPHKASCYPALIGLARQAVKHYRECAARVRAVVDLRGVRDDRPYNDEARYDELVDLAEMALTHATRGVAEVILAALDKHNPREDATKIVGTHALWLDGELLIWQVDGPEDFAPHSYRLLILGPGEIGNDACQD